MSLTAIYAELHRRAHETGEARGQNLTGGARLTVRVSGSRVILTIARKGKLVGDRELITFRAACGVPEGATRRPETGQSRQEHGGALWYYVSYTWESEAGDG